MFLVRYQFVIIKVVLNHRRNGEWGMEEKQPLIIMIGGDSAVKAFNPGHTVHILIESTLNYFQVYIKMRVFVFYTLAFFIRKVNLFNNLRKHISYFR